MGRLFSLAHEYLSKTFLITSGGGDTIEEFLHDFPSVSKEQINQLLELIENLITLSPNENKIAA